jgi:D-alanine-D-alanine ligase
MVVVYGGPSAEHEVSCISALRVAMAARRNGRPVRAIGFTHDKRWVDASSALEDMEDWDTFPSPDDLVAEDPKRELDRLGAGLPDHAIVFPILHGPFGEDGVFQGYLEVLDVPYVGAGVLSSSICMDKTVAKELLFQHELPVAAWARVTRRDRDELRAGDAAARLGYPLFVKPANLGSSIGITKVHEPGALVDAVDFAFEFDDVVVLEENVVGRELELAVLGNDEPRVTGAGEIVPSREFYDYEDKYELGVAKTIVPMGVSALELRQAQELALAAYHALRVEGLARVDLFLRAGGGSGVFGGFVVNEVNTMPGFTPISMFPMLWEAEGLPFGDLVEELLALGLERHERRRGLRVHRKS